MKVLVVCARRYNGHELWTFLGVLQEAGVDFEVISTSTLIEDEITHQPNLIDRTLDDIEDIKGFDGLAFVSGNMKDTEAYWSDLRTLRYVRQAIRANIPIAAICCSVPTVAAATYGKRVSYFPLQRSTEILERAGALCQTISITVDGKLVTAEHQMATQTWAEAYVRVLNGDLDVDLGLRDSGFVPGGKGRRKPDPEFVRLQEISRRTGKTSLKE